MFFSFHPKRASATIAMFVAMLANATSHAGIIAVDDIILTEQASARVLRLDSTGTLSILSAGGFLANPIDATVTPSGRLFVVDTTATGSGAVVQIDPTTGNQTVVANGGDIAGSVGIASDSAGNLFVTNQTTNTVVRIDGTTFAQSTVPTSVPFNAPYGIQVASTGELIVNNSPNGTEFILGVDVSGSSRTITSGGDFIEPISFDLDATDGIYLANQNDLFNPGNIMYIDSVTGDQTVIASGGFITSPQDLAIDSSGNLFFTNQSTNQLIRIDHNTLTQTVVSSDFTGILSGIDIFGDAGLGPAASVPEPTSFILCGLGFMAIGFFRCRRRPRIGK